MKTEIRRALALGSGWIYISWELNVRFSRFCFNPTTFYRKLGDLFGVHMEFVHVFGFGEFRRVFFAAGTIDFTRVTGLRGVSFYTCVGDL